MTVGERLEEARKRKGVAISEAADATKIRSVYLIALEEDSRDIGLPEVYVRGFLRNYGRYLRMNVEDLLAEYDAVKLDVKERVPKRPGVGRMEIPKEVSGASEAELNVSARTYASERQGEGSKRMDLTRLKISNEMVLWLQVAAVGFVLLLVGWLGVTVVSAWRDKDPAPDLNPELRADRNSRSSSGDGRIEGTQLERVERDEIIISATANVTLIVDQTIGNERLYSGTLTAGEEQVIERQGPVQLRFSDGSAFTLTVNGSPYRVEGASSGVGRAVIP